VPPCVQPEREPRDLEAATSRRRTSSWCDRSRADVQVRHGEPAECGEATTDEGIVSQRRDQRHQTNLRVPIVPYEAAPGLTRSGVPIRCTSACGFTHSRAAPHGTRPWRGQICLVRSLPRRRGMSQRDRERTLGRLPTDASFRRDSFPEPGPRLSRAQTSGCAHEAGSAAVAHFSPPVMAASAITRNDRLSAATVAVQ
jgi:hypothetical protein